MFIVELEKKAKELRNGAFKVFLKDDCLNPQLAIEFLRYPPAMVDTLLEWWAEYLESSEYARERARARSIYATDQEAIAEKKTSSATQIERSQVAA